MDGMNNGEIIQLLINLSERYDSYSIRELISELEVDEDFMNSA